VQGNEQRRQSLVDWLRLVAERIADQRAHCFVCILGDQRLTIGKTGRFVAYPLTADLPRIAAGTGQLSPQAERKAFARELHQLCQVGDVGRRCAAKCAGEFCHRAGRLSRVDTLL
jgi:hypothetical protein